LKSGLCFLEGTTIAFSLFDAAKVTGTMVTTAAKALGDVEETSSTSSPAT